MLYKTNSLGNLGNLTRPQVQNLPPAATFHPMDPTGVYKASARTVTLSNDHENEQNLITYNKLVGEWKDNNYARWKDGKWTHTGPNDPPPPPIWKEVDYEQILARMVAGKLDETPITYYDIRANAGYGQTSDFNAPMHYDGLTAQTYATDRDGNRISATYSTPTGSAKTAVLADYVAPAVPQMAAATQAPATTTPATTPTTTQAPAATTTTTTAAVTTTNAAATVPSVTDPKPTAMPNQTPVTDPSTQVTTSTGNPTIISLLPASIQAQIPATVKDSAARAQEWAEGLPTWAWIGAAAAAAYYFNQKKGRR